MKSNSFRSSIAARIAESLLRISGFVALSYVGWDWGQSSYAQWQGSAELGELERASVRTRVGTRLQEGALFGRVSIPRLQLSAIVFEGVEPATLTKGVGHLSLAGAGNRHVVLAAHRDTFFRPLRDIQVGDDIELSLPEGHRTYTVASTSIVDPTATEVLRPSTRTTLTLITCYPFSYLGAAPQRFIVQAVPKSESPGRKNAPEQIAPAHDRI